MNSTAEPLKFDPSPNSKTPACSLSNNTNRKTTMKATREQVIAAWSDAERRIGKFVNLDQDTLNSLIGCPMELLEESVRSILGRK